MPAAEQQPKGPGGDGGSSDADTQPDDTGAHVDDGPDAPATGEDAAEENRDRESPA